MNRQRNGIARLFCFAETYFPNAMHLFRFTLAFSFIIVFLLLGDLATYSLRKDISKRYKYIGQVSSKCLVRSKLLLVIKILEMQVSEGLRD